MNRLLLLALIGLVTVAMVSARGGDSHGDDGDDRRGPFGGGFGGGFNNWRRCACSTQCTGNTGTNNFRCAANRTTYIQCQEAVCSVQTCPDNNLFNYTSRQCEACPTGFHVDAYQRKCVCDQGTTFNRTTQTCTSCPVDAVVTADRCYCSATALSKPDNACKACPAGSTLSKKLQCRCNDTTAFWSENDFACKQCPGAWVNRTYTERRRRAYVVPVCECQGTNEVFNKYLVACSTCPAGSVVATNGFETTCRCSLVTQKYDSKTNTCVDRTADSSNDSREWPF